MHQRYHDDRDREAHGDGQIGIGEGFDLSLAIGQQPQLLDRGLLASQRIAQGGGFAAGDRRRPLGRPGRNRLGSDHSEWSRRRMFCFQRRENRLISSSMIFIVWPQRPHSAV